MRKLPPDPDELNDKRALSARTALNEFIKQTKAEPEFALSELLCALMHMADRSQPFSSFEAALESARDDYSIETTELEL